MKGTKRIWLMAILFVAALAVLAACDRGGNNDPPPATPEPAAAATPTPAPVTTPEPTPDEPDMRPYFGPYANDVHDFGGRTVTMTYSMEVNLERGWNPEVDRFLDRVAYFEDRWNFTFEFLNAGATNYVPRIITSTMAGDPIGDLVYVISRYHFPNFVLSNIATPVCQWGVVDQHLDMGFQQLIAQESYFDEQFWAFNEGFPPRYTSISWNTTGVFFNRDLFERENLPLPYDMVRDGTWTWDAMLDLAQRATRDTTGDNIIDQFGFTHNFMPHGLIHANAGELIGLRERDFRFGLLDANAQEALNWYGNARQYPIFGHFPPAWNQPILGFRQGEVAMNVHQWWIVQTNIAPDVMTDAWGWVPLPDGPSANGRATNFGNEASWVFIPSSVSNPEEIAIIYEAITKDPLYNADDWMIFVERFVHDFDTIEMLSIARETQPNLMDLFLGFRGVQGEINNAINRIASGEQSALAAMQGIEGIVDSRIREAFELDHVAAARMTLARAEAQFIFEEFSEFIEDGEVLGTGTVLEDAIEEALEEVEEILERAEAAIEEALDAGFEMDEILVFAHYWRYVLVRNFVQGDPAAEE